MPFALPCYSTFRTVTFPEDSEDKPASFEEGETLSFFIFRFKLFLNCYKILTGNHDRILRKPKKHQSKMYPKSSKISPKWGPGGIFGRPGALPRGREASGLILIDFGDHFGTHLGGKMHKKH